MVAFEAQLDALATTATIGRAPGGGTNGMARPTRERRRRPRPRHAPPAAPPRPSAGPAHHRGDLPLRHGRRQLVVRPARQRPDRVRLAGAADRRPRRPGAGVRAARPRPRGRAHRGVVRGAAQRRAPAALPRRGAEPLPAILARNLLGWYGDPDAVVDAWVVVPALPGRRPQRLSLRSRVGGVPRRPARGPRRARPRGRHAAGARPRRGGAALPDPVLGRAHGRGADAATPTSCTSPRPAGRRSPRSCTRRCTGRRWS